VRTETSQLIFSIVTDDGVDQIKQAQIFKPLTIAYKKSVKRYDRHQGKQAPVQIWMWMWMCSGSDVGHDSEYANSDAKTHHVTIPEESIARAEPMKQNQQPQPHECELHV